MTLPGKPSARPAIGYAGPLFPSELADAVGADLIALDSVDGHACHPLVSKWIDDKEGGGLRNLIAAALDAGAAESRRGIVVMRAAEQAYYYLRELQRLGVAELPTLHMFDLIASDAESFRLYNRRQLQDLVDALARITGIHPDEDGLRRAIARGNARRARMRDLSEARWAGAVDGSAAVEAILSDQQSTVTGDKAQSGARRLLVIAGEPILDTSLHRAVEHAGFWIVAEDDGSGRFYPAADIDPGEDALGAIARHYAAIPTIRCSDRDTRLAYIRSVLARGVDAVLALVDAHDHQFGWDIPALREESERSGANFVIARAGTAEHAVSAVADVA